MAILAPELARMVLEMERERREAGDEHEGTEREAAVGMADRKWIQGYREPNVAD